MEQIRESGGGPDPAEGRKGRYHHGSLRAAILKAAETIIVTKGVEALTLRGAARLAGGSHAAPKNHFGDLAGLLSELAAIGFIRLREAMLAESRAADEPARKRLAIGRGYVSFALGNPGLFLLMFRSGKLDMDRPSLREAATSAFAVLAGEKWAGGSEPQGALRLQDAARVVGAWSKVHGLAMLMIDGRLAPLTANLPPDISEVDFAHLVLGGGHE
jgi:AcrR family transcriptional regulator